MRNLGSIQQKIIAHMRTFPDGKTHINARVFTGLSSNALLESVDRLMKRGVIEYQGLDIYRLGKMRGCLDATEAHQAKGDE